MLFGISKLKRQREQISLNCQLLRQAASQQRHLTANRWLHQAASAQGLLGWFILGFVSQGCQMNNSLFIQLIKQPIQGLISHPVGAPQKTRQQPKNSAETT